MKQKDLKAGFSYHIILKGESLNAFWKYHGVLIFIIRGAIRVSADDMQPLVVRKSQMFFWDEREKYVFNLLTDIEIVCFSFNSLLCSCDKTIFQHLSGHRFQEKTRIMKLSYSEPLITFLQLLVYYLEKKVDDYLLYEAKQNEMFLLFRIVFTDKDIFRFFGLLTGKSFDFKMQVLENYSKVKDVGELSGLLGYGKNTFRLKFKKEFGTSVYRWLQEKKSKEIVRRLTLYDDNFTKLVDDFGFSSYSHFNKFCKSQYGLTPSELRERIHNSDEFVY